jgi:polar amino acid transport system permease protein
MTVVMQVKFDVLEVFAAAAVLYLVMTTLWDQVQRRLERRFDSAHRADASKVEALAPAVEQAALQR